MEDNRKSFKFQLNIGFIVFIILFVYLTITIVANLMKDRICVCRVEGSNCQQRILYRCMYP